MLQAAFATSICTAGPGSISDDAARLHLVGGSVSVDLGLSAGIMSYIENGA